MLIGSCRSLADFNRVQSLKNLADKLNIATHVKFVVKQGFQVLKRYYVKASMGLHTMWNEHFGIAVVEMMAAGLITIAHDSGGVVRLLKGC